MNTANSFHVKVTHLKSQDIGHQNLQNNREQKKGEVRKSRRDYKQTTENQTVDLSEPTSLSKQNLAALALLTAITTDS